MPKTGDRRVEFCDECNEDTEFYFEQPYPGSRETPPEPGGWICQECGWTWPDEYDYNPNDEEW